MEKIISFRVSEDQYNQISKRAQEANQNISDYLLNTLFPEDRKEIPNMIDNDMVVRRIEKRISEKTLTSGQVIVISDLFTDEEWTSFYNAIPYGRKFNRQVTQEGTQLNQLVEWMGKGSSPAKYRIK